MTTEKYIPLHILEEITKEFSAHSRIGTGGYGDVYKGVHNKREIAVKLLRVDTLRGLDDQQFTNEVGNLLRANHPNIVQLVGYCYETRNILVEHNGVNDFSQRIYRVICLEYLQGGSLDKRLYDQSFAPDWSTRYNIIKGISEGLNYLHKCVPQIWHLDLKPANILLDSYMEPKLADFGLSRLFAQSHTHVTESVIGTRKYMPPEFIEENKISPKNDVFSLGVVMIEIMKGPTGYSNSIEMGDMTQLSQEVLTKWSTMIEATSKYQSEELHQVKTCIDIAMHCVDSEKDNRPTVADILDTLNKTEAHIPKKQVVDMLPYQTLSTTNRMAKSLNTMTTEVGNIASKYENCDFVPRDTFNINVQQVPDRETTSNVEQTLLIGRTEEKQEILSILSDNITEEMVILPIYGVGGIGKTTLAQLVFNDTQFKDYSRVWVYVPQKFDLNKIGNSIISQLTKEGSHIADKQMLHNRLGELLSSNRILIVLDDLWEENPYKLDELKAMLRLVRGSKVILVTTRVEAVARKICLTVMQYKLEGLTDDMCWTIIQQKCDFENRRDKDQLEQIGKDIAIKCRGVALVAQSCGYTLRDMTSDQWHSIRDNNISHLSRDEQVFESLRLNYSHMTKWMQLCFSYCAVFPKGHNIVKHDLIHQWIALGFAEPYETIDSMQLCEEYVTRLLGMSFLEYSKAPSSHRRRGEDITLFTMHDLVHDLAIDILADKVNKKGNVVGSSCQYALVTDCSKPLQLSPSSPENNGYNFFLKLFQKRSTHENIKALFFLDSHNHGDVFSQAKCLHVLHLSECCITKLPGSIGQLKNLRYLHAPRIQDKKIPNCITELTQLNYLNLRDSYNILALPESIGDMKGLMHLDLSGCRKILELPVSFAELKQLVHLDLSHCSTSISEAFGGFTKLQYLNLSGSEVIEGKRRGLSEVISNLVKLRYLNLSGSMNAMAISEEQIYSLVVSISTLPNLEHLDLSWNSAFSSIPESIGNHRKLHTLDLSHCHFLKKLPDSIVNMVSLKFLIVDKKDTIDESVLSVLNIPSLPHFVVHASSDKCSSNIMMLQPTDPDQLTIDRLENVKFVEEAESIKLIDKHRIEELKFQWTGDAERFVDDKEVLEKLVPPSSVHELSIAGYRSVGLPVWLMGIGQYLPNLSRIELCDFPRCNNLPLLSELPNLVQLSLCRLEDLEEWNSGYTCGEEDLLRLMFPKLKKFRIEQCAKLRTKPCLPGAQSLYIKDCDNMLSSSWGESSASSSLIRCTLLKYLNTFPSRAIGRLLDGELFVEDSKMPMCEWRLLQHLPPLGSLTIKNCSDLTASPEIINHLSFLTKLCLNSNHQAELPTWLVELTALKELWLDDCNNMTSLPEWLGDLKSLITISISDCEGIMSLPGSIKKLTGLKMLLISGRSKLMKWFESKENKKKVAHIPHMSLNMKSATDKEDIFTYNRGLCREDH